jgi:hypothetical protein
MHEILQPTRDRRWVRCYATKAAAYSARAPSYPASRCPTGFLSMHASRAISRWPDMVELARLHWSGGTRRDAKPDC